MPKRVPTGIPQPAGSQRNQSNIITAVTTMTASKVINPLLSVKKKGNVVRSQKSYEVIGLTFQDAGGTVAETAQRLSSVKNADGTFTVYAEKVDPTSAGGAIVWIPATGTNTFRWTVLITG